MAEENLLHGGMFFAARQKGICCTADGTLQGSRFLGDALRIFWGNGANYFFTAKSTSITTGLWSLQICESL